MGSQVDSGDKVVVIIVHGPSVDAAVVAAATRLRDHMVFKLSTVHTAVV